MSNKSTATKIRICVAIIVLLSMCLCVTSYALVWASVSVNNNYFHTGTVDININDGLPVISEHEFIFEPGMTVEKNFFIENNSTWNVFYKIYLDNVSGGLADVLEITIKDGDRVLYQGKASALSRQNVAAADDELAVGERKVLTIYFHFPESAGNSAQDCRLAFDLCAEAVQTKNNSDRTFN